MKGKSSLEKLQSQTKRKTPSQIQTPNLNTELSDAKLPADPGKRMDYLLKERSLLIEMVTGYQEEQKVKFRVISSD